MNNQSHEETKVGFQLNMKDGNVQTKRLIDIFKSIGTSTKLAAMIDNVRNAPSADAKRAAKDNLPSFIVSSETSCRKASPDDIHTGLILIDIDGKDNELIDISGIVDEMAEKHPFIIGSFTSPSGDGIKVLCGIEASVDTHKRSFMALESLFLSEGICVDRACKDPKRINYLSSDPLISTTLIKPWAEWGGETIDPAPEVVRKQYKAKRNFDAELSPDDEASLCLEQLSPDIDYEEWLAVGMACHSHGAGCAVWEAWSRGGQTFRDGECERKWKSFSGSGVNFASVVHMATQANGGVNPLIAARNARPPVVVDVHADFDDVPDEGDDVPDEVNEVPDESPKLGQLNIHYHKGKFYILDATETEYISINGDDLTRKLRGMGYSNKGADGELSAVDKLKDKIIHEQFVHHVGVIAGRSIGMVKNENGIRHLVTRQNKRVKAVKGSWDTIKDIVDGVFGADQLPYFFAWMHRSRRQLEKQHYLQGHALVIAGGVGKGKSLMQSVIIGKMLGGSANSHLWMTGATPFNADLVSNECLFADDDSGDRDHKSRQRYGDRIKLITAGSKSIQCHGKGVDGYMVEPLWRGIICMNDDDQSLGAFPAIGEGDCDSVGDKVLMLKCLGLSPIPFTGDRHQSDKLEKAIRHDLPGFAHFIDSYEIPASIKTGNCRFGFDEYHHPELIATVNQDSNERTLLSVTDSILFDDMDDFGGEVVLLDQTTQRYYWEGSAVQWSKMLLKHNRIPQYKTVAGMLAFGDNSIKAGKAMTAMCDISNGRVVKMKKKSGNVWRIWEVENG